MSSSAEVGNVSESLRNLLEKKMDIEDLPVTILSPDENSTEEKRLNLFLYRIVENPFLRNSDWVPRTDDQNTLMAPPLSLSLHYLLTPYLVTVQDNSHSDSHSILGEAMRVLHENPVIPKDSLVGLPLKEVFGQIKITPVSLSVDDISKIWNAFKNPFRLSVAYEISILQIDTKVEKELPKRVEQARLLPPSAEFRKPHIKTLSPRRGRAGDTVQIFGNNLANWSGEVKIGGEAVLPPDFTIENDEEFSFVTPDTLAPGMYEVHINVGNIARSTLFFEVTL